MNNLKGTHSFWRMHLGKHFSLELMKICLSKGYFSQYMDIPFLFLTAPLRERTKRIIAKSSNTPYDPQHHVTVKTRRTTLPDKTQLNYTFMHIYTTNAHGYKLFPNDLIPKGRYNEWKKFVFLPTQAGITSETTDFLSKSPP